MADILDQLVEIKKTIDKADSLEQLQFISVNTTFKYIKYKKAILSINSAPIRFSGSENVDPNSSNFHWYKALFESIKKSPSKVLEKKDLSKQIIKNWGTYLFTHSYYLNVQSDSQNIAFIFSRDEKWSDDEIKFLKLIIGAWEAKYEIINFKKKRLQNTLNNIKKTIYESLDFKSQLRKFQQIRLDRNSNKNIFFNIFQFLLIFKAYLLLSILFLSFYIPTAMTVISPAEIVPLNPTQIKSPRDGIIDSVFIESNSIVNQGDQLIQLDTKELNTRYLMLSKSIETLNEELRQRRMKSLKDNDSRSKLIEIQGKVNQTQLELDFLKDQLDKSTITALHSGLILSNPSSELIGKPVITGESLMKLTKDDGLEIEVWLDIDELIELEEGGRVKFFSLSNPFRTIEASIQYISHHPTPSPKNVYAYKIKAEIHDSNAKKNFRAGYAGYAKLYGKDVYFFQWFFKKPLQFFRRFF